LSPLLIVNSKSDDRCLSMKHLLLTTIAAVVLVGCGESVPDISIHDAIVLGGDIEAVKQHLAAGTDVDAKDMST